MIRCDKKIGAWELILNLPFESDFFPTEGIKYDKEWEGVIRCDKKSGAWELILKLPDENGFSSNQGDKKW